MAGVIADASPLIALHQIGQISLIERLFGPILIPSAVAREVSPSLPTLPTWITARDLTRPIGSEILRASWLPCLHCASRQGTCRRGGRSLRRTAAPSASVRHLFWLALIALIVFGCHRSGVALTSTDAPPILLFNGTGTSPNDVAAIETLLDKNQIAYSTANSAQLDEMSEARLRSYRLIIVPGGDFTRIGNGLRKETTAKLRDAVQHGVRYLGICGGAFFAGRSPYNGLNLTSGVQFGFYSAEARGVRKTAVLISGAKAPALDQYWEDGPQLSGWGTVVGRYPDDTPAVVQGPFGKGWIILTGVHPEAPESWRCDMEFTTPADVDNTYAVTLIRAAMERRRLPHF